MCILGAMSKIVEIRARLEAKGLSRISPKRRARWAAQATADADADNKRAAKDKAGPAPGKVKKGFKKVFGVLRKVGRAVKHAAQDTFTADSLEAPPLRTLIAEGRELLGKSD